MISIIIPTLNEEKFLGATLKNLKNLARIEREIIVSDSQSKDSTLEVAKRYADKIVSTPTGKRGISTGKNTGAAAARGDYLVFIDADVVIPQPDEFFSELLNLFAKDEKLLALTVPIKVYPESATRADKFFFGLINGFYFVMNNIFHKGNASGEFQMIRASAFRAVRGYREDLVAGEDNDMFIRLSKIGKTRFFSRLCVYHSGRRAHIIGWRKLFFMWIKNGIYIYLFNKSAFKEWEPLR